MIKEDFKELKKLNDFHNNLKLLSNNVCLFDYTYIYSKINNIRYLEKLFHYFFSFVI